MRSTIVLSSIFFCIFCGCRPPEQGRSRQKASLFHYFKKIKTPAVLHFEIAENDFHSIGDTLSNNLFFSHMPTRLMNGIEYFDNSDRVFVIARNRFPLNDGIEALLVDIRQGWYQNQSLFLFDPKQKQFTDRMTVAEFYGGDGGQILTGSYLLDYDGDADKDLVRLEMEHWIDASTDPPVDKTNTHAALLLWDGRQFVQSPVADTADLIKRFPLNDFFSRQ